MNIKKYLVTIVVPGRFHAFDLARQLEKKKLLLKLITSIPSYFVINRFKVNKKFVLSLPLREFFFKFVSLFPFIKIKNKLIDFFNFLFELQATTKINYIKSDIIVCWSGSAEKIFLKSKEKFKNLKILERGSSHIEFQNKILLEEHKKFNLSFNEISSKLILKEKREYELADKIIVPSNFAKQTFINHGIKEDKVIKIPLGVSLKQFNIINNTIKKKFIILCVGTLSLRKGFIYLIQAFIELNLKNAELFFVGDIDFKLKKIINKYKNYKNIRLFKPMKQEDLIEIYNVSSLFVLFSLEEGMAMVIPQAMACGLPIICTKNTGGEEVVQDNLNGFVSPNIRDVKFLKNKISLLYENPNLLKKMGQESEMIIKNKHTWDNYGDKIESVYFKLLNNVS